jgi:hypothetical protein
VIISRPDDTEQCSDCATEFRPVTEGRDKRLDCKKMRTAYSFFGEEASWKRGKETRRWMRRMFEKPVEGTGI